MSVGSFLYEYVCVDDGCANTKVILEDQRTRGFDTVWVKQLRRFTERELGQMSLQWLIHSLKI